MNINKFYSALACLGITLLLVFLLWGTGFFSYFDTTMYDFFLNLKVNINPRALNPQIIPVDLNDKTEMTIGDRLDDRTAFGDIFSVMSYSRARVALDFIFQGERENDSYMLEEAAKMNAVFAAIVPVPEGREDISYRGLNPDEKALLRKHIWRLKEFGSGNIPRAGTFIMPFMEFGELSVQLSHISIDPDSDGIYRRTPLFYRWEDGFVPSVSLASAVWELGIDTSEIEIHYGKEVILPLGSGETISIPIDNAGNVIVPYRGRWEDTTHRYSFDIIANARYDEKTMNEIRNDIMRSLCFVADTTFVKKDLGPTPLEKVYPLSGVHTWVISGILDASLGEDTFYHETPAGYRLFCIILFALVFIFLGSIQKDWIYNTGAAVIFFIFTGLTFYLWFFRRIIPWYGIGALEILIAWIMGFGYRFLTQRRRQSALERYVPRSVAQKIVAGQRTSLVPVHKDLTIMFTDIRGFTTWSSDKEAQLVHNFLNNYLESMADILFAHGATVDKFMGDGILAFFGDPLDYSDNAERAVIAAIAMQYKIDMIREEWMPVAGINLKVRMGINTGKVIVGDLGTRRRIEYTVIGSAVNLAQRMEGLASPGGILVTEFTRNAIENSGSYFKDGGITAGGNKFSFSEKRELEVKGYDRPIAAYEIIF